MPSVAAPTQRPGPSERPLSSQLDESIPAATRAIQQTTIAQTALPPERVITASTNSWGCLQPIIDCIYSVVEEIFSCFCGRKSEQAQPAQTSAPLPSDPAPVAEEIGGIEIESIDSKPENTGVDLGMALVFLEKAHEQFKEKEGAAFDTYFFLAQCLLEGIERRKVASTWHGLDEKPVFPIGKSISIEKCILLMENSAEFDDKVELVKGNGIAAFCRDLKNSINSLDSKPDIEGLLVEWGAKVFAIAVFDGPKVYHLFDPINKNNKCELKSFSEVEPLLSSVRNRKKNTSREDNYVIAFVDKAKQ